MTPPPQRTERGREHAALAGRLRSGEPGAEAEFVETFRRPLLALMHWRARDPMLAEELAHDALLAVITAVRAGRLRDDQSLSAYLHGTARNLLANRRRRDGARPPMLSVDELELAAPPVDFDRRRREILAQRALGELEGTDRRILELTLHEELPSDEIGRRVGLSPDAVRMRRSRTLRRLAERIGGWLQPAPREPHSLGEEEPR